MTIIVLTACPAGLRGHLTRWLLEISAGVFVGTINSRVRDLMWQRVIQLSGSGRALMVYQVRGEQRLAFKVSGHHWEPVDRDGLMLMRRPHPGERLGPPMPKGWSKAGKRRRYIDKKHGRDQADPSQEVNENPPQP